MGVGGSDSPKAASAVCRRSRSCVFSKSTLSCTSSALISFSTACCAWKPRIESERLGAPRALSSSTALTRRICAWVGFVVLIDNPALCQDAVVDGVDGAEELTGCTLCRDDKIDGHGNLVELRSDTSMNFPKPVEECVGHQHRQVQITVPLRLAARPR